MTGALQLEEYAGRFRDNPRERPAIVGDLIRSGNRFLLNLPGFGPARSIAALLRSGPFSDYFEFEKLMARALHPLLAAINLNMIADLRVNGLFWERYPRYARDMNIALASNKALSLTALKNVIMKMAAMDGHYMVIKFYDLILRGDNVDLYKKLKAVETALVQIKNGLGGDDEGNLELVRKIVLVISEEKGADVAQLLITRMTWDDGLGAYASGIGDGGTAPLESVYAEKTEELHEEEALYGGDYTGEEGEPLIENKADPVIARYAGLIKRDYLDAVDPDDDEAVRGIVKGIYIKNEKVYGGARADEVAKEVLDIWIGDTSLDERVRDILTEMVSEGGYQPPPAAAGDEADYEAPAGAPSESAPEDEAFIDEETIAVPSEAGEDLEAEMPEEAPLPEKDRDVAEEESREESPGEMPVERIETGIVETKETEAAGDEVFSEGELDALLTDLDKEDDVAAPAPAMDEEIIAEELTEPAAAAGGPGLSGSTVGESPAAEEEFLLSEDEYRGLVEEDAKTSADGETFLISREDLKPVEPSGSGDWALITDDALADAGATGDSPLVVSFNGDGSPGERFAAARKGSREDDGDSTAIKDEILYEDRSLNAQGPDRPVKKAARPPIRMKDVATTGKSRNLLELMDLLAGTDLAADISRYFVGSGLSSDVQSGVQELVGYDGFDDALDFLKGYDAFDVREKIIILEKWFRQSGVKKGWFDPPEEKRMDRVTAMMDGYADAMEREPRGDDADDILEGDTSQKAMLKTGDESIRIAHDMEELRDLYVSGPDTADVAGRIKALQKFFNRLAAGDDAAVHFAVYHGPAFLSFLRFVEETPGLKKKLKTDKAVKYCIKKKIMPAPGGEQR